MNVGQSIAWGVATSLLFAIGCKQEQRTTTIPPGPVATTPSAPATTTPSPTDRAAVPAPGTASAVPEPPNPPSLTGLAPQPPAPASPGPAERAGRAIGALADDATLTAKVKTALLQAPDVKGTHVTVESEKGAVQLSGFVESQAQIDRAVQIAQAISGVKEVHNKMSLKAGK